MRFKGISPSMVVALVALVAALGGTAFAATATIVNIADPSNPAHVAKVDALGNLKSAVTGSVTAQPAAPTTPFDFDADVSNYYNNGDQYPVLQKPTKATVALDRMVLTNSVINTGDWEMYIYYETVSSSGVCQAWSAGHRQIAKLNVRAGDTLVDDLPTPIVLQAASGQWCLVAGGGPSAANPQGNDSAPVTVGLSGFVVAGALNAGPTATSAASSAHSDRLGG